MSDLDTHLVKCPNGHEQSPTEPRDTTQVEYEYEFVTGDVGRHNYCRVCGAEMIDVE